LPLNVGLAIIAQQERQTAVTTPILIDNGLMASTVYADTKQIGKASKAERYSLVSRGVLNL